MTRKALRPPDLADLASFRDLTRIANALMVDAAYWRVRGPPGLGILFFFRQAPLEGFDALGDIAHNVGDFAFPAEDQQNNRANDKPVPDRKSAHGETPLQKRNSTRMFE